MDKIAILGHAGGDVIKPRGGGSTGERGHNPDKRGHYPDKRGHNPDKRGHYPDKRGHNPDKRTITTLLHKRAYVHTGKLTDNAHLQRPALKARL